MADLVRELDETLRFREAELARAREWLTDPACRGATAKRCARQEITELESVVAPLRAARRFLTGDVLPLEGVTHG